MDTEPENIGWSIPHYIDASIAVKLVITEDESSQKLQACLIEKWSHHFHITEFAFYETLSALKNKMERKIINQKQYLGAVFQLISYLKEELLQIDSDFRLDNGKVLFEVWELVKKYSLDYSDALQIYTILNGKWSHSCFECTAIFVTADSRLAEAGKNEGLRVWNPLKEPNPPGWEELNRKK